MDYVEKFASSKNCMRITSSYHQVKTIDLTFETRILDGKLPFELTFAYSIIIKMHLSCLDYGILSVHKRVTCIISEVLTARHECFVERYFSDLDTAKRLANCRLYTKPCLSHPFFMLFCTTKFHRRIWDSHYLCKLCVKKGPASVIIIVC